jgi:hypothetical protein
MKEKELLLIPEPGQKPAFLATIRVVDPSPAVVNLWNAIASDKIVLEGYTRDGWAWKPSPTLTNLTVESTDGRKKVRGFAEHLKERQKSAYGRFGTTGVWVVSYIQKKTDNDSRMDCRVSLDFTKVPHCSLKLRSLAVPPSKNEPPAKPIEARPAGKKSGFLGKLVGAQQRTNHHVAMASTARKPASPSLSSNSAHAGSIGESAATKTAQKVLAEFRQACQDKMLDFDLAAEEKLEVPVTLATYTAGLSFEDKAKVTMEILKYMVYEAAEEVNEEWIAYKEPGGFMDEATFAIYKEGAAPPEVLEELNKGELPDEVIGQQRAMQDERVRQANQAEQRHKTQLELAAHRQTDEEENDDFAALNSNKRDRRTIEDYEREKRQRMK